MDDLWYDPFFDYDGDGVMDNNELADMDVAIEWEEQMMEYEAEMEAAEYHLRRAHEILYGPPPPSSSTANAGIVLFLVLVALAWLVKSCLEGI